MSLSLDFTNRTVWVTGGASGIGAAVVTAFVEAGARVVSFDRAYLAETPGSLPPGHVAIDLRDGRAVQETCARLIQEGLGPHVLVNNAGITRDAIVWRMTDEDWQEVLDVNLTAAFRLSRACSPFLRETPGTAIVNVASINALRGKAGQANYAAAKAGLIALTKTLAKELGRRGVRVNAVAPGMIETPMTRALDASVRAKAEQESALGRIGQPEDVAWAVLFLASPFARHITGQILIVDGGQLL